jgi:hypothetical protein
VFLVKRFYRKLRDLALSALWSFLEHALLRTGGVEHWRNMESKQALSRAIAFRRWILAVRGRSPFTVAIALLLLPLQVQADSLPAIPAPTSAPTSAPSPAIPSPTPPPTPPTDLDLDPQLIQSSPTLRKWLQQVPNVQRDIAHDPSFRTRLRVGYGDEGSWSAHLEDVFVGSSGLALAAQARTGEVGSWGGDLRYYLRPLGKGVNVAPVVGYRYLEQPQRDIEGLNLGARLMLVPSRGGGADISLSQSWVNLGGTQSVGLTGLGVGYALTHNLRLGAEVQWQNSPQRKDSWWGIGLEWMF